MKPLVSVILPTKNRVKLLGRSINSILSQTFKDFELIIIDDASSDGTENMVRNIKDDRIRYVRLDTSGGAAVARNKGISLSRGKYIAFQDDDDEWLPTKLEKQVEVLEKIAPEAGIVYTNMWEISDGVKTYTRPKSTMPEDGIIFDEALNNKLRNIGIQTTLIRKECFKKTGGFDTRFPRWIDHEFLIHASRYFRFYHINEALVNWHITPGSICSNRKNLTIAKKLILEKYAEAFNKKKNRRAFAQYCYDIGHGLCLEGDMESGRKYICQAIKANALYLNALIALPLTFLGPKLYYRLHPL